MTTDTQDFPTGGSQSVAAVEHASLAAAVEQAADGVVMTDINGNIQYVNPAFTAMTGYTSEEAIGQNPRVLKSGRHPEEFYSEMWRTIQSGSVWRGELTNRRKDGTFYVEEMRIAPVRDPQGATIGYIAIKHDVTEQHAAQEAQAFLAAIVESSGDAVIAYTPAGTILTWNRGAETVLGYSAQEAIGERMSMLAPLQRRPHRSHPAEQAPQGKDISHYEALGRRKDGRIVHVFVTESPIHNPSGELAAISVILRDISERREAEHAQALLASIVEYSDDAIAGGLLDGTIVSWNRAAEALFGFSRQEIIGKNIAILAPPDRRHDVDSRLDLIREGKTSVPFETVSYAKDCSSIAVSIRLSPILNSTGEVVGCSAIYRDIRKRVLAERKLRESQELFREVFEHGPVGIFVARPDGRFIQVNAAFCRMLGYSEPELLAKTWPELCPSEDLAAALQRMDLLWKDPAARLDGERSYLHRDGSLVWCNVRMSLLRTDDGIPLCTVVHVEDITARRAAEETQAFLAAIVENSEDSIIACTPDGTIRTFNRGAESIFGYSSIEAIGQHMSLLVPPDRAAALQGLAQKLLQGDRFSQHEGYCLRKDGRKIPVSVTGFPIVNTAGDVVAIANILRDITERMQADLTIRENEARFRSIFEYAPFGMCVTGLDGRYVQVNEALCRMLGYSAAELLQTTWIKLTHPDDREASSDKMRRLIAEPAGYVEDEMRCTDRLGNEVWVRIRASLVRDGGGSPQFFVVHVEDITERKQAKKLREFQHSLVRAIHEVSLDGILVVNAEGNVVSHNRKFLDIWNVTPEKIPDRPLSIAIGASAEPVLSAILERVVDPDAFLKQVQKLNADLDANDQSEIELKDGRTLERYTTCLRDEDGKYMVRAWFFRDITERRQAELAMIESENRFRIMADSCPIGIWVTDEGGRTLFMNRTYRRFCSGTEENQEQDAWRNLLHPEDAPSFLAAYERAHEERKPFKFETRCRRADGEWRWLESFADPRFSQDGEFLGLVGTSKDITERKQVESDLVRAREEAEEANRGLSAQHATLDRERQILRTFIDIVPDYMYVKDLESRFVIANRSVARWAGVEKPEDLLGKTDFDFCSCEPASRYYEDEQRVIRTGQPIFDQEETSCPDGSNKVSYRLTTKVPLIDGEGHVTGLAGIGRDITARKQAEADLVQAREAAEAANRLLSSQNTILDNERVILRALIDNVPDLMWVKDAQSRFVVANRVVAQFNGMEKPEDLLGKTDFDFFPPDVATGFYEEEQSVIRSGQPLLDREETSSDSATGEVRYCLSTKVPLFDSGGHATGLAGIGRNITERKRAENALRESNRQLQETTARANELALEASAASRAKSEFLANMSHEIRTPMNGVLGMNGLLLGSNLDAEQRHWAEVVDVCAKSLLTVIDDILDFSKIEAGKLEIDSTDFNLRALMDDFAEMMTERVREKQLEFICAVAPDVCTLLQGDPGRLRQVLLNLASNAIKFTHQGEVVVRVSLISETAADVWLRFCVRDTGIGIPENKQQILFTSFTQVDASTTRQYGGTGLGLAICKKLIELMGGEIGLVSKEGEGSEFWFTICLAKQLETRPAEISPVPVRGARILVVDDNATNREVITAQLHSWGAIATAVEDGATALACLRDAIAAGNEFRLAVLDMMMPGMDGATLGRTILADETLKNTPLVLMTSMGQRGDARRFKEIGFAAYLIKPVRQSDLFDCLASLLAGEQPQETRALVTRHSLREVRRNSARILLVEDNYTNQEVASGMLKRLGWSADVASDGKQAVEALETQSYDLVLMDVQMPEMDGYEATRLIRDPQSRVLNHNIPIIATTAHAMQGDAEKCLAAGMSDYIAKPIDPKILAVVVEKWLLRKTHPAPGIAPSEPAASEEAPREKPESGRLVFNSAVFLERMMGDEGFAREVAAQFLQELPTMLSTLKEQVAREDIGAIWKQAHKIKGAAANVGGDALRDAAWEVEQAGKAADLAEALRWIPELEIQTARLIEALQQWA